MKLTLYLIFLLSLCASTRIFVDVTQYDKYNKQLFDFYTYGINVTHTSQQMTRYYNEIDILSKETYYIDWILASKSANKFTNLFQVNIDNGNNCISTLVDISGISEIEFYVDSQSDKIIKTVVKKTKIQRKNGGMLIIKRINDTHLNYKCCIYMNTTVEQDYRICTGCLKNNNGAICDPLKICPNGKGGMAQFLLVDNFQVPYCCFCKI